MNIKITKTKSGAEMNFLEKENIEIDFESLDELIDILLTEEIDLDSVVIDAELDVVNYKSMIEGIIEKMKLPDFQEAYKSTLKEPEKEVN